MLAIRFPPEDEDKTRLPRDQDNVTHNHHLMGNTIVIFNEYKEPFLSGNDLSIVISNNGPMGSYVV